MGGPGESAPPPSIRDPHSQQVRPDFVNQPVGAHGRGARQIEIDLARLETQRIIAHDHHDPRSRSFDMMRTQILQSMDLKEWQTLAVTSPSPGCGKTLTAINLALSMARQRDRSVLLVDMDLKKPQIGSRLGFRCDHGIVSVLDGHASVADITVDALVGDLRISILPCERPVTNSSERMASRAMSALLVDLAKHDRSQIVILDLPPMLAGDDVISILPHIDCVLFVAAVRTTTITEIKECNKHLHSSTVVRVALNKVTETGPTYPAYY